MVVVPSISFPVEELEKIVAVQSYEERMLFVVLFLLSPKLRVVYVTSERIDPAVVSYYLSFLPDPDHARRRLTLVDLGDPSIGSLSEKLLRRPDVLGRLRAAAGKGYAYVLPFNVTPAEAKLAEALRLPLYGARPELASLGSKSGSKKVAERAGVPVLPGWADVFSVDDVAAAIARMQATVPDLDAVVVKLNNGFSGQGNAIVELDGPIDRLESTKTTFCAAEESWPSFAAKIAAEGAVVEMLARAEGMASPSVQMRIAPDGTFEIISTHDQILGGPENQVYLGCRFPASAEYRKEIQDLGVKVAEVLAAEGVVGSFGIDFLVIPGKGVFLSEINLRMGGTTHPFWMARLATGGVYDPVEGELRVGDQAKHYVATDNLKSPSLVGRKPAEVIEAVGKADLWFDPETATGTCLHMFGALPAGKMGVTCVADSAEGADELYRRTAAILDPP
jgi:hypothetical protein